MNLQQMHLQELHEHELTTGEPQYVLLCLILETYLGIPQDLRYTKQMEDISQCNDRLLYFYCSGLTITIVVDISDIKE